MTRFMMSLDDAIKLVEYAMGNAQQGDLFIHKAQSCKITDLAHVMQNMFNVKNSIKNIGIRHGEKLHEVLASSMELAQAEDLGNYFRIPNDTRDLNYSQYYTQGSKDILPQDLQSNLIDLMSSAEIKEKLLSIDYVQEALEQCP